MSYPPQSVPPQQYPPQDQVPVPIQQAPAPVKRLFVFEGVVGGACRLV